MEIIPVIDLLDGQAVHAKQGNRAHYRPIRSPLCSSSHPLDVINAYLELYPFKQLYIADINAIQKQGDHLQIIEKIQYRYPQITIWLDAGISTARELPRWRHLRLEWVIGTESLGNLADYIDLRQELTGHCILSLDFKQGHYQGPGALINDSDYWPDRVIAMTLSRVGSHTGADVSTLASLLYSRQSHQLFAAGGIRDMTDLRLIEQMGINGALIATALHSRALSTADIASIASA